MNIGQLGMEAGDMQDKKVNRNDLLLLNNTPQTHQYFCSADVRYLLDKGRL